MQTIKKLPLAYRLQAFGYAYCGVYIYTYPQAFIPITRYLTHLGKLAYQLRTYAK